MHACRTSLRPSAAQTPSDLANQAEAALRSGNKEKALALLDQAAQTPGATAESEDHVGFFFAALGRSPDALSHFQKAISLNADFAPAHYHLGVSLWLAKDHEHGLPELLAARDLSRTTSITVIISAPLIWISTISNMPSPS